MRTALSLSFALALSSCASLQGDGYYSCARGGHCPSSAPVCGADGLCHAAGVDAGVVPDTGTTVDGGAVDTNPPPLAYDACNGDTPGTCAPGTCYYDPDLGATNDGYCTRSCASDAECPSFGGASSLCVMGQCVRGCHSASDCTDVLACASGRWTDGSSVRLCSTLVAAEANWYQMCEIDADCDRPLSCVNHYCLRSCASSGDCVPDLEICITSQAGARGCLYMCSGAADCNTLDGQCMGGGCHPAPAW
jgi:hypothetical protein